MRKRSLGARVANGVGALLLAASAGASGQSIPPTPATDSESTLEQVVVTGARIPINESIVPTVRPNTAAFGLEQNIMEVPRNVTIISRAQLDDVSIQDVRDFSKLTTSSYTTSNFGAPTNPSIRGEIADVFINGMRKGLTSNGNGLPLDFNSVESVDIFKGPPTVVYGASQYVGGFVNLQTKQPFFDKFHGSVSGTVGSYDQYRWNLDLGGPIIKDKLAYRISYSGEESNSYYENGVSRLHSIYGALTWTPSTNYSLALSGDLFFARYTENFGLNRPTQDLIDNDQYFTGPIQGYVPGTNNYGQLVQAGGNSIVPTGTKTLDHSVRLLRPGDGSYGRYFEGQAIQTLTLNDSATIVNNTLFQYINRHTKSSYFYDEIITPALSIENRTELHLNFDVPFGGGGGGSEPAPPSLAKGGDGKESKAPVLPTKKPFVLGNQVNLGVDVRYQEVTAYDDFFNEPANAWDLSLSRSLINYQNFSPIDIPVPGHPSYVANPGEINGDTNRSRLFDIAPFYQHVFKLGDKVEITGGGRADVLLLNVMDPLAGYVGETRYQDRSTIIEPNANGSINFRPTKWLSTYFTYNYSQSFGSGNGGGLLSDIPIAATADYHRVSQLFEFGGKLSLLQDTLFVSSALFQQERNDQNPGGSANKVVVRGFEIEADYQPSRNFYLNAGYSFLDARVHGAPSESQQFPINDPRNLQADGTFSVDNFAQLPNGSYRDPGLPKHLFNVLARYQVPTAVGTFAASLGTTVYGPYDLGYGGYVRIPWQYEMDLTLSYKTKDERLEARVAFLNLTDTHRWSPPDPFYGYSSVVAEWPFHVEGTITLRF